MSGERRVVVAGGGTGGHVTPALALGEVLREDGDATLFIGTRRGLEVRLVPEAGFDLVALDSRPLVGRSPLERVRAVLALATATLAARRELARFDAELVLSVGGYAAVPVTLAAVLRRTPIALVEPNAIPGQANRLVARFAKRIFLGFAAAGETLLGSADDARLRICGVPLRRALVEAFRKREADPERDREADPEREPAAPLHLFVFGGSQGARQINETLMEALPELDPGSLEIVHQTGEADRERVDEAYRRGGFRAEVVAFERDMPSRYRWADLVLCRAGALTVAELALAGRAAILVPLAHVGGGEQLANARELARAGAATVLDSRELTPAALAETLRAALAEPGRLVEMGERAAELARPDAARQIVDECKALLRNDGTPGGAS